MSFFNDTYCQTCDRLNTKEQWSKHVFSNRHLHREVAGYWPASFPQRKLTKDEGSILEEAFWKKCFFLQLEILKKWKSFGEYIL